MESSVIVCIIALAIVIVVILLLLGVLIYNQMLCVNEVNKRLLLITKESIDKERSTQEQLQDALIELDRATNENNQTTPKEEQETPGSEEPFNPHTYEEQQQGYTEE